MKKKRFPFSVGTGRVGKRLLPFLGSIVAVLLLVVFWGDITSFFGLGRAQASGYQMQTGYYVGDGASKQIAGLGFTPDVVILKADTTAGTGAIMKTTAMPQNNVAYLGVATADDVAAQIQLTDDGFLVTGALSNTVNVRHAWIAFTGSECDAGGQLCVGSYTGDGALTKNVTTGFDPDLVLVKRSSGVAANWRSSAMPNNYAQFFMATAQETTGALFTTLNGDGFTVGSTNNVSGGIYYYVAFKEATDALAVGTYTGNSTDNRSITGVGFEPNWMFTKQTGAVGAVHNFTESYGDSSSYFTDTANLVNAIQALEADGFQVGTSNTANATGITYYYATFGGAAPMPGGTGTFIAVSGTYVGNGDARVIGNIGFKPDLVTVTASGTEHTVFTTSVMGGDSTAYLANNVANIAGAITTLSPSGFTVGSHSTVNTAGVEYHWVAYGNAWNPDTRTGSADFVVGAYYGNGIDNRSITRLPFAPDMLTIKRNGASQGTWRTSEHVGDSSSFFHASADATNYIQSLNADGFEIGTAAHVNTAANLYWYFGFATGTNFAMGSYTGTGVVGTVTTPIEPNRAWVKQSGSAQGVIRPRTVTGSTSLPFLNAMPVTGAVDDISGNDLVVGTAAEANASGATYRYAVWKDTTVVGTPPPYQMQTGYYVGDGGAKVISGLGFTPEVVILKADTVGGTGAIMKTTAMPQNNVAYLGVATADSAAGAITLTDDGFRLAGILSNTVNNRYTWIAFTGSDCALGETLCVGRYTGDGALTKNVTTGFDPDLVLVKRSSGVAANWRSSAMPNDYAQYFMANAEDSTGALFTTLNGDGFTVGSTNNASGGIYYYLAFKEATDAVNVGTYTGNSTDNRSITDVGFEPNWVFTKQTGAIGAVYNLAESYGDSSSYFTDTANLVNAIQALEADGFQVGTSNTANATGITYYYAAFGGAAPTPGGTGTFLMSSGSYVGTGEPQTFGGLPFVPDMVVIAGETTEHAVFTTRMMGGDSTAYFGNNVGNFTEGITAIRPDSFKIGTHTSVNTPGVTYHYVVYGNAWNPDTRTGSADFVIGAYYGNGIDNRTITGLPFTPHLLTVKRNGATQGAWRTSEHTGDASSFFHGVAESANVIQDITSDGFEVGTAANVNTAASTYWYFGFATGTKFAVGTYSGTGIAQTVDTPIAPTYAWVKHTSASQGVLRMNTLVNEATPSFIANAPVSGAITGFSATGFTVGTASEANFSGTNNYRFAVWRTPNLHQKHYHIRADDGSETTATSETGGVPDMPYTDAREGVPIRLRFGIHNEDATSTAPTAFRLEYAERGATSTCLVTAGWQRVTASGSPWSMFDTANLINGEDTTNIATSTGGVPDGSGIFVSPNGGVRDTEDETAPISLPGNAYTDLEYAIVANGNATSGTTYCFRTTGEGVELPLYSAYPEVTFYAHMVATTTGEQISAVDVPTPAVHIGGAFVLYDAHGTDMHAVTEVTIREVGSIDASVGIGNVSLFYEYDTDAPYDCADETYDGTEASFGVPTTFSGPDGTASFAGSLVASTTQAICLYPVLDILEAANNDDTILLEISNVGTDVVLSGGEVVRGEVPLSLSGTTTVRDYELVQHHYHFRHDDGSESGATSATGGVEDTEYMNMPRHVTKRVRFGISNDGATSTPSLGYRLEYGARDTTCDAVSVWTDVGASGGAFTMSNSSYLTDGDDTTDIGVGAGGVANENVTFKTPNGGVKDTSSETSALVLADDEYLELEYAIQGTAEALDGESYCFRVTREGVPLHGYNIYAEATMTAAGYVSALGTHAVSAISPGLSQYLGGVFMIEDQVSTRNVTSITITETGTIDASADLSNIQLWYEHATISPYTCADEGYDGTEAQFGTPVASFTGPNGTATFTDSVPIATSSPLCVYVLVDVGVGASNGDTIKIEISDPGSDVVVSPGAVNPNTMVSPAGVTTVEKLAITQTGYHFRNDDGTEADATSATQGNENTGVKNLVANETVRLRLQVHKGGISPSPPTVFGLEYAERVSTCDAIGSWTGIETGGGHWALSDSPFLTNGEDTTNIATSTGGISDGGATFMGVNGGVRDETSTTSPLVLDPNTVLELEYGLEPTTLATPGATYCFRLTAGGVALETYDWYGQASVRPNQDFYVQRGMSTIPNGSSSVMLVAGVDYVAPSASTSAFIRITNAAGTGAGRATLGGSQRPDRATAGIADPSNITSSVTFTRTSTVSDTRVYWEVVEYIGPSGGDNEIVVRAQQQLTYGGGNSTLTTPTIGGVVDDSNVVVFITGQQSPGSTIANYHQLISTAEWDSGTDTAIFTRGATGDAVRVSYAVVEFTGSNWKVQRRAHTYNSPGATETETIATVNSVSRAFIHTQKRVGVNQVDAFGHQVWLSNASTISYSVPSTVSSIGTHVSVAWVIENTQTSGQPMVVTQRSATQSAGSAGVPTLFSIPINKTLPIVNSASIFMNMWGLGNTTDHPRAIMGATIASSTHFELWISDSGSGRAYRTEIVEWPTAELTLTQNYYRWYAHNDALTPDDPWPPGGGGVGENTTITRADGPPTDGDVLRLRMSVNVTGGGVAQGNKRFALEYGERETTCDAIGAWQKVGGIGSSTALWRGYDATPFSGVTLSGNPPFPPEDLVLSVSDRAGTYEEEGLSTYNPYKIFAGEDVEYDWVIQANGVPEQTVYCFRMVESDGTPLHVYDPNYPALVTAGFEADMLDWRFYDDEESLTPLMPLAATNTAPTGVGPGDVVKLRILLKEVAGKAGQNVKFKLQYSTASDFASVYDVADVDSCAYGSRWCYAFGAGDEGEPVDTTVVYGADVCSGGVGDGCGTHNEYSYTPAPVGEVGTTTADYIGTVITLQHTYTDPVFIVEAISGDATGSALNRPAVAVITATSTSSFTVRIQEPDDEDDDHGAETVAYLVMERGAYQLPDGRRVDVGTRTTTHYRGNALPGGSDDTCSFVQTFSHAPIVYTALQTNNNTANPDLLTVTQSSVTANTFVCSMEVPSGGSAPGNAETIGWVAIEGGAFGNNLTRFVATSTPTSVTGWDETPWYEYVWSVEYFGQAPGIVASKQTRNGGDGGWVRYDTAGVTGVQLAIDEAMSGNRFHTPESVGLLAFSDTALLFRATSSGFTFSAGSTREFEFTLTHKDAQVGQTYFFRLYDVGAGVPVGTSTEQGTYPSIVSASGTLSLSIGGVGAGVSTEGVVTDATSTPTAVHFGTLPLGVDKKAAQRLTVSTNAGGGYQVFMYSPQALTAGTGATFADVLGTNASPLSWANGCLSSALSCYGYHAGDNTLKGGSTRFLLNDTYAAFTDTLAEVAHSSGPVKDETTDIIYRIQANSGQPAGTYESKVVYIVVPVF